MPRVVSLGNRFVGPGQPLLVMAGPCVIEEPDLVMNTARILAAETAARGLTFVFKASYDKANRTSIKSFRGPGPAAGLELLAAISRELGVMVMSDVHDLGQIEAAAQVLDIIQIPAFLCRQTDLVQAVASTGRVVNIKKGQFLAPWDITHVLEKITATGNDKILVTERGTTFGYNNLVVDFRGLPIMRSLGWPVVFDATHSVQLPGGGSGASGGESRFIPYMARAAVAAGIDGLFMEVHPCPDKAWCDGPNSLDLDLFPRLLDQLLAIDHLVKGWDADES